MTPIAEAARLEQHARILNDMMRNEDGQRCDFDLDWVRQKGWSVVPVPSAARIAEDDVPRIVETLRKAGYAACVVIATEPLGDLPTSYDLAVSVPDFLALNRELGPFRFLVTHDDLSWGISCNEWYNLFAGQAELVERFVGKPLALARREFLDFATDLARTPDEPLLRIAREYSR